MSFGESPFDDRSLWIPRHWKTSDSFLVRFIHRKDGNFLHGIESISEMALEDSVLRENKSHHLSDITKWQGPIIPTEHHINRRGKLTTSI
jgi:hypothetical protein